MIGNSAYAAVSPLANPKNDAALMAKTLRSVGFDVTEVVDADQRTMKQAMLDFGRKLRDGADASLFYYSGHGVQARGENYLIPVDAEIKDEGELDLQAVDVNAFLNVMEGSASKINIVILDACRNNPFGSSFRSASRGLTMINAPSGTYIAYSTGIDQVAEDGTGANSPYTEALAEAIVKPGVKLEDAFKDARRIVKAATNDKQVPWESTSITGDFYFVPEPAKAIVVPSPAPAGAAEATPVEPPASADQQKEAALPEAGENDAAADGILVFLGRSPTRAGALDHFHAAQARFPKLLGDKQPNIKQVSLAGRTVFRVRVGPFAGLDQARAFCGSLKSAGGFCQVAKNGAVVANAGAGQAAAVTVHAMGELKVPQTYLFDLDGGVVTEAGADVWFEAKTESDLFLVPRNGAALAAGRPVKAGFEGCASETYSSDPISFHNIGVGSFICVKTSDGRIGSFRIDGLSQVSPRTLALNYVVWE